MDLVATEAEVRIGGEPGVVPKYKIGLLAHDLESLPGEAKLALNSQIRKDIALSLKTKFLCPVDHVALLLDEYADAEKKLWIKFSAVTASVLTAEEQVSGNNQIEALMPQLIETAGRSDDRHDLPEHMRALIKKFDHIRIKQSRGEANCRSRFSRYLYPGLGVSNISKYNQIMPDLITTMCRSAGTIIDTGRSIQFITAFGIGVHTYKEFDGYGNQKGLIFAGLIDLAAYTKRGQN